MAEQPPQNRVSFAELLCLLLATNLTFAGLAQTALGVVRLANLPVHMAFLQGSLGEHHGEVHHVGGAAEYVVVVAVFVVFYRASLCCFLFPSVSHRFRPFLKFQ